MLVRSFASLVGNDGRLTAFAQNRCTRPMRRYYCRRKPTCWRITTCVYVCSLGQSIDPHFETPSPQQPLEPLQLAFPATIGTPEAAYLLGNLSQIVGRQRHSAFSQILMSIDHSTLLNWLLGQGESVIQTLGFIVAKPLRRIVHPLVRLAAAITRASFPMPSLQLRSLVSYHVVLSGARCLITFITGL